VKIKEGGGGRSEVVEVEVVEVVEGGGVKGAIKAVEMEGGSGGGSGSDGSLSFCTCTPSMCAVCLLLVVCPPAWCTHLHIQYSSD
jgi:hypothetical protein